MYGPIDLAVRDSFLAGLESFTAFKSCFVKGWIED